VQLAQPYLKDGSIATAMKLQEYGAYMATTFVGKFEVMAMGTIGIAWDPVSVLCGLYAPAQPQPRRRPKDDGDVPRATTHERPGSAPATHFDIQRYAAEQQYCV
jgi:hypothetical protein